MEEFCSIERAVSQVPLGEEWSSSILSVPRLQEVPSCYQINYLSPSEQVLVWMGCFGRLLILLAPLKATGLWGLSSCVVTRSARQTAQLRAAHSAFLITFTSLPVPKALVNKQLT